MRFDIARQPFVPAFLTLLAITLLAMWGLEAPVAAGTAAAAVSAAPNPGTELPGLAIDMPQNLLLQFQLAHPLWAKWIGGLMLLLGGLNLGRLAVSTNLYGVSSCLAIPLYGILLCITGFGSEFLTALTEALLLALTIKNYSRSFGNGYRFDALFRASLYLGLLVLLRPALLPLVLLLPATVWIFRRTLREATAACAGLLLPLAAWCYVNWGAGGTLSAPLLHIGTDFASGTPLTLFLHTPLYELIPAGCMLLFGLFSALHVLSEFYTTGMKPRFIFIFNMTALLLTTLLLGGPDAARNDACLIAVPASLLIPFSFVRINRAIVWPLYLLLAASAVISSILQ